MEFHGLMIVSDIHADESNSQSYENILKIIDSELMVSSNLDIIFCGDIAYSGKMIQYEKLTIIFDKLRAPKYAGRINSYFVPGNHDADFTKARNRERLLRTVGTDGFDEDLVATLNEPFSDFRSFVELIGSCQCKESLICTQITKSTSIGVNLRYILINSAITSRLHEQQGQLMIPCDAIEEKIEPFEGITFWFMHHGTHWMAVECKRKLETIILKNCNFLVTGHEHIDNEVLITTKDFKYTHIECPAFLDPRSIKKGLFALRISKNNEYKVIRYGWGRDNNICINESEPQSISVKITSDSGHTLQPKFAESLEDIGFQITHPRVVNLSLWDIYIDPFLGIIADAQASKDKITPKAISSEFIEFKERAVIIRGVSSSGKTSLSKKIFKSSIESGNFPILISGRSIRSNSFQDFIKLINREAASQYELPEGYDVISNQQLKVHIIIDDYQLSKNSSSNKLRLLSEIIDKFKGVAIFVDETFDYTEATAGEPLDYIAKCTRYEIKPWNSALRSKMIKKWVTLGATSDIEDNELIVKRDIIEKQIDHTLRNGVIPAYPSFVLAIIQTLESHVSVSDEISSQGHFYNALLVQSLARQGCSNDDVNMVFSYLSSLARHFYENKTFSISESSLDLFDSQHKQRFDLPRRFSDIRSILLNSRVLDLYDDQITFRYKYSYYYFLAKNLSDSIEEEDSRKVIAKLCSALYNLDNANVVIFLTHHTKSLFIVNLIVENARKAFSDVKPCRLADDLNEVYTLCDQLPEIDAPPDSSKVEENREKMHANGDVINHTIAENQKKYDFEFDASTELDQAAKFNHAFKNIDIIGQILKNHFGDFVAEVKQNILQSGIESGLRIMSVFFESIAENKEFFVSWIKAEIEHELEGQGRKKDIDENDREKIAKTILFQLCLFFGYAMIKRLSYSLGNENLEKTFSHLSKPEMTPSESLLLFSYKLDHIRKFPKQDIDDMLKIIEKYPVANFAAKRMAVEFCAQFRSTPELRQFITTKFKLGKSGHQMLINSSANRDEDNKRHAK